MSGPNHTHPPRLVEALLRALLPAGFVGEAILGDLHAGFDARVRSGRAGGAANWYRRQALLLGIRYLLERVTHHGQYNGPAGLPSSPPPRFLLNKRLPMLETILSDIRYAVRTLRKEPGWTAGAVCTLALAIGATTSIFSVVNAVMLKPLAYAEPERLVALSFTPANAEAEAFLSEKDERTSEYLRINTTYPNFREWQEATGDVIDHLAAFDDAWNYDVNFGTSTERMPAAYLSSGALRALGVLPEQGRWFLDEEDIPGGANVVILSHALWRTRFGPEEDAVGRIVTINEKPHTIVGVMPADFVFPTASSHFWMPMAEATQSHGGWNYEIFGRLKHGVSFEQANALLSSRRIESTSRDGSIWAYAAALTPLHNRFIGDARPTLLIFLAAVCAVLLIACVNVINLMLTRATHREHEHVVRGALGAGRARSIQQMLTESLTVCLLGAGLGLILAVGLTDLLVALSPASIPRREHIAVDGGVLLFTVSLALIVGLGVGLAPSLQTAKADLAGGLNVSSRGISGGIRHTRLRDGFVIAQLGLALTLLVGGGTLLRSFAALLDLETGVDPRNVLVFDTSLPESRYQTFEDRKLFYDEMRTRLRSISGVQTASLAVYFPASGWFHTAGFEVEGYTIGEREELVAEEKQVTPDYFETLRITAIGGRLFNDGDGTTGPEVAIVSESLARRYWPDRSAVGGRIKLDNEWVSVVGVVEDVKYRGEQRDFSQLYRPYAAGSFEWSMDGLLKLDGDPIQYAGAVRAAVAAMDPDVVVADLMPLEHFLWDSVSEPRFRALLIGAFGIAAVLLSIVGVYGVMAYAVAQRTREFGIRKALGADRSRTIREVVLRGLILTASGVGLGLCSAYAGVGVLQSYLFNVSARDPITFVSAILLLSSASMLACCIPAIRAARVDPLIALRAE